jgi:hypothetical protein
MVLAGHAGAAAAPAAAVITTAAAAASSSIIITMPKGSEMAQQATAQCERACMAP